MGLTMECETSMQNNTPHVASSPPIVPAWTSLRFFAALWIIVYHFGRSLLPFPVHAGIPVSFFFFLSGFVLAYSCRQRRTFGFPFLFERWARLGPLYWLALGASFLLAFPFALVDRVTLLPWLVRLEANVLGIQTWIPDFSLSLNPQSWAVSVELTLYVWFLLVAPRIFRMTSFWRWGIFFGLWLTSMSVLAFSRGWVWDQWFYSDDPNLRFVHHLLLYHPLIYVGVFTLGMLAAPDHREGVPKISGASCFLLAMGGIAVASFFQSPVWRYLLHVGILAPVYALLLYSLRTPSPITKVLSSPQLSFLGTCSYGMYIFQHPLGCVFNRIHPGWTRSVVGFVVFALVLVGFSIFLYCHIESPLKRLFLRARCMTQREHPNHS